MKVVSKDRIERRIGPVGVPVFRSVLSSSIKVVLGWQVHALWRFNTKAV